MARFATVALAAVALFALLAAANATIYDDNIKAFTVAIKKYPQYSVFASQYVAYLNSSNIKKYSQQPAVLLIPTNDAIKNNPTFQKLKLSQMLKVVGFHAILFKAGAAPIGAKALVKLPAGITIKTQQGDVITKVSAPGKVPAKLRGKKPTVVNVIQADLFASSTLNAMGIDGIMTPPSM